MERACKLAWWATAAGLVATVVGLVVLFACALSEVQATDHHSGRPEEERANQ